MIEVSVNCEGHFDGRVTIGVNRVGKVRVTPIGLVDLFLDGERDVRDEVKDKIESCFACFVIDRGGRDGGGGSCHWSGLLDWF